MAIAFLMLYIIAHAVSGVARPGEKISASPVILEGPKNVTTHHGENVTLECRIDEPIVWTVLQWLRHYTVNDSYLSPEGEPYVKIIQSGSSLLELNSVTSEDSGWYTCLVSNSLGRTYESAWLNVKDSMTCPDGWLSHRDKCYYFSNDMFSWIDSQMMCKALNGKLAEIQTETENEFLVHTVTFPGFWIGVTDMEIPGTYKYIETGTAVKYSDLLTKRRPKKSNTLENCIEIVTNRKRTWRPANCRRRRHFVCERLGISNHQ